MSYQPPRERGIIIINELADFPEPVGGKIILPDGLYRLTQSINIGTNNFRLQGGGRVIIEGIDGFLVSLTYEGVGNMFDSEDLPILELRLNKLLLTAVSGNVFNITNPGPNPESAVILNDTALIGCDSIGLIKNIGTFGAIIAQLRTCNNGLTLDTINNIIISKVQFDDWPDLGGTLLTLLGIMRSAQIQQSFFAPKVTESALRIDPTSSISSGGGLFVGNSFLASGGGVFFESGLTGNITAFADAGGGFTTVTSTAHGLSNGNTLQIFDTINYNGGHTVSSVTANTFVIDTTFVADDATGTFDSGSKTQIDPEWDFQANGNIPNSDAVAFISMITNATETVISTINTPVKAAGIWTKESSERFDFDSSGRLTYTGLETITKLVQCNFRGQISMGANKDFSFYIAKNGTIINTPSSNRFDNADNRNTTVFAEVIFNTGDFVEFFIENNTDIGNMTIDTAKCVIS